MSEEEFNEFYEYSEDDDEEIFPFIDPKNLEQQSSSEDALPSSRKQSLVPKRQTLEDRRTGGSNSSVPLNDLVEQAQIIL